MSHTITTTSIIATVRLEEDGSYSIGLEDAHAPEDSERRHIAGLSEGFAFDAPSAARFAGGLIAMHLSAPPMQWRNSTTGESVPYA